MVVSGVFCWVHSGDIEHNLIQAFRSRDCEWVCRLSVLASYGQMGLGGRQWPGVAAMKSHCAIDTSQQGQELWNMAAEVSAVLGASPGDNW
jgi:hypothetical protein